MKEEAAGEGSASPSKADTKKRGLVKDDPDAKGVAESESPAKKAKIKKEKEPKIKNEVASGESENEGQTTKKAKPRAKKETKIKTEDAEAGSDNDGPANKKTKAATKKAKKAKKASDDEADGDFEEDAQPVKKGRRQTKKATAGEEAGLQVKDESSDHDALPPAAKKTRAPRKAATTKKLKDEGNETDDLDPAFKLETPLDSVKLEHTSEPEADPSEGAPKLPKGGKKKVKKAVNGTAEEAPKEVKSKVRMLLPNRLVNKLTMYTGDPGWPTIQRKSDSLTPSLIQPSPPFIPAMCWETSSSSKSFTVSKTLGMRNGSRSIAKLHITTF